MTVAAPNDPAGTDLMAVLVEASHRIATLTARQLDVLECLGRGLSNRQISSLLAISEYTVKVHIGNIMTTLGLDSRLQIGIVAHHHLTGCPLPVQGQRVTPRMTLAEARVWLAGLEFGADRLRLEAVEGPRVVCTAGPDGLELRPDFGAVSGPAVFWAVDLTGFVAVNVLIGPSPAIVLAHADISFLALAEAGTLRVTAEVVNLASRPAVVTVRVADHRGRLVAVSTLHFALPSRATRAVPPGAQAEATAT